MRIVKIQRVVQSARILPIHVKEGDIQGKSTNFYILVSGRPRSRELRDLVSFQVDKTGPRLQNRIKNILFSFFSHLPLWVAGQFVPCPLRNLPLRTSKKNRPTSSYHLYLSVRTTSIPTTSYLPLRTPFLNVLCREMESIRNLIIQYFYCIKHI